MAEQSVRRSSRPRTSKSALELLGLVSKNASKVLEFPPALEDNSGKFANSSYHKRKKNESLKCFEVGPLPSDKNSVTDNANVKAVERLLSSCLGDWNQSELTGNGDNKCRVIHNASSEHSLSDHIKPGSKQGNFARLATSTSETKREHNNHRTEIKSISDKFHPRSIGLTENTGLCEVLPSQSCSNTEHAQLKHIAIEKQNLLHESNCSDARWKILSKTDECTFGVMKECPVVSVDEIGRSLGRLKSIVPTDVFAVESASSSGRLPSVCQSIGFLPSHETGPVAQDATVTSKHLSSDRLKPGKRNVTWQFVKN